MRFKSRRGFTFIDLMALLLVGAFALGLLIPAAYGLQDNRNMQMCLSNLRQIGQALILYANDNRGAYPRVKVKMDAPPVFFTKKEMKEPFDKDGPVNDVTAAAFLLIRTEGIESKVFVCPFTKDVADNFGAAANAPAAEADAQKFSNFQSPANLSYSFANPYPSKKAVQAGYRLNNAIAADFALAADINPGGDDLLKVTATSDAAAMEKANSPNHGGDGQNVLYGDGHAAFEATPFAGVKKDNIYTYGKSGNDAGGEGIIGSPIGPDDSVLLPVATKDKAAEKL